MDNKFRTRKNEVNYKTVTKANNGKVNGPVKDAKNVNKKSIEINNKENHEVNEINKKNMAAGNDENKVEEVEAMYLDDDNGPYVTCLEYVSKDDDVRVLNDMTVGKLLKELQVNGIIQVKKIGRIKCKIQFDNKINANAFLTNAKLKERKLKAYIPTSSIMKIGIIYDIPTEHDDEFLKQNIESDAEVTQIFRYKRTVEDDGVKKQIPTRTVKVTFRSQVLPREVTFFYAKRLVKPFIPKVIQCYKCLRYGHTKSVCKQTMTTCENCATIHEGECDKRRRCFNCKSPEHHSKDPNCPEFARQQVIKEAMVYRNLSYVEANEEYPKVQNAYSILEHDKEFPTMNRQRTEKKKKLTEVIVRNCNDVQRDYEKYKANQQATFENTKNVGMTGHELRRSNGTELRLNARVNEDECIETASRFDETEEGESHEILGWIAKKINRKAGSSMVGEDMACIEIMTKLQEYFGHERFREMLIGDRSDGWSPDTNERE